MHRIRTGSAPDLSPVAEAIQQEYDDSANLEGNFSFLILVVFSILWIFFMVEKFLMLRFGNILDSCTSSGFFYLS